MYSLVSRAMVNWIGSIRFARAAAIRWRHSAMIGMLLIWARSRLVSCKGVRNHFLPSNAGCTANGTASFAHHCRRFRTQWGGFWLRCRIKRRVHGGRAREAKRG